MMWVLLCIGLLQLTAVWAQEADPCDEVTCRRGEVCLEGRCVYVCRDPKEPGPCNSSLTRYYNDPDTRLCKRFIYGGCGGNLNNFQSVEDCANECGGRPDPCMDITCGNDSVCFGGECAEICSLRRDPGRCSSSRPSSVKRYYHDPSTNICKEFMYSGCRGNQNNFETVADCTSQCGGKADPCENLDCPIYEKCVLDPKTCGSGSTQCDQRAVCEIVDPCRGKCKTYERCLTLDNGNPVCVRSAKNDNCPSQRTIRALSCENHGCRHDYDCPHRQKCCYNSCSKKQCVEPYVYSWSRRN